MTSAPNTKLAEKISQLMAYESTAERPDQLRAALGLVETDLEQVKDVTAEHFESGGISSLLAYYGGKRPGSFDLILNAHLDVVPGNPDQFKPVVRDGCLYGRGAVDMKSAAVIMTELFCELAPKVPYTLGLQIVTDEEVGGHNGTKYQIDQGVRADFVVAGEDTPSDSICTDMCGTCWVEFEMTGKSAHSGYVWRGDNAVVKATKLIEKLLVAFPIPKQDAWATTANVAFIETPSKLYNRVPDSVKFGVDFRYIASDTRFLNRDTIAKTLRTIDPTARFTIKMLEPSHSNDPQNGYISQLAAAVKRVTGKTPPLVKRHGSADVRFYSAIGTTAVTMGLPDNHAHAVGEFVELDALSKYSEVLRTFLTNFKPNSPSSPQKSQQS